jgi:hypothetical protein
MYVPTIEFFDTLLEDDYIHIVVILSVIVISRKMDGNFLSFYRFYRFNDGSKTCFNSSFELCYSNVYYADVMHSSDVVFLL